MLKNYHEDVAGWFKAPPPKYPVIVLIDNDSGADSVYEAIAGITKKPKPAGRADFIHVISNLYVVPTPFGPGKKKTTIEDFFDAATLETPLNGKKFSLSKKIDEATQYGKAAFARDVIAKKSGSIHFDNFKKILDRVVKVLDDYDAKRVATPPTATATVGKK